jgi:hypothetical protein
MNPLFLGPLADLVKSVLNKLWPDPAAQAEAQYKLAQLMQSGELAQMANDTQLSLAQIGVNNTEAAGTGFKANWRPFIGWVCGSALAWNFIVRPGIVTGMALYGHPVALPSADMAELMPVLLGMLGLGALRTAEKIKGVA